jgi:hypothetical protein
MVTTVAVMPTPNRRHAEAYRPRVVCPDSKGRAEIATNAARGRHIPAMMGGKYLSNCWIPTKIQGAFTPSDGTPKGSAGPVMGASNIADNKQTATIVSMAAAISLMTRLGLLGIRDCLDIGLAMFHLAMTNG